MSQTTQQQANVVPLPPPMAPGSTSNPTDSKAAGGTCVMPAKKTAVQRIYTITFILLRPITFPFSVTNYFFRQTKNITLVVYGELKKVVGLGFNALEFGILLTKSMSIITFKDGNTKPLMPRMMEVYNRMAETLTDFHALPCTKESGALGHLMLSRLPQFIWDYMLPYPHPFFRGSVTQAIKTDSKLITSTETVPNDYYSPFVAGKKK